MIILIALFAVAVIYDAIIIYRKGVYYSISAQVIRTSKKHVSVPFCFGLVVGFVCGHLFWSMDESRWKYTEEELKARNIKIEKCLGNK